MFKKAVPFLFLAAGVGGFLLRRQELLTIFNAETGFAEKNAPISLALMALSAAAILAAVIFAATRKGLSDDCVTAFRVNNGGKFVYVFSGLLLATTAADWVLNPVISMPVSAVAGVLALATGVAVLFFGGNMKLGKTGGGLSVVFAVPPLFFCYLLALTYKQNSGNPAVIEFCYKAVAFAAAAVAMYYVEGYICGRARPRTAIAANLIALYFLNIALAGTSRLAEIGAMLAMVVVTLMNTVLILRDPPREEEDIPNEE